MNVGVVSRREMLAACTGGAASIFLSACATGAPTEPHDASRISARPRTPSRGISPGVYPLGLGSGARDGQVLIPATYGPDLPIPLIVLLHGASGTGSGMLNAMRTTAELLGMALLAPDSRN